MNAGMQMYATYFMLGNINTAFSPMFAIQISSLLMTLVKKNIIKPAWWQYLYGLSLLTNVFLVLTMNNSFIVKMNIGCYFIYEWRIKYNYNKYIGWGIVFLFHYLFTPDWDSYSFTFLEYTEKQLIIIMTFLYFETKYRVIKS